MQERNLDDLVNRLQSIAKEYSIDAKVLKIDNLYGESYVKVWFKQNIRTITFFIQEDGVYISGYVHIKDSYGQLWEIEIFKVTHALMASEYVLWNDMLVIARLLDSKINSKSDVNSVLADINIHIRSEAITAFRLVSGKIIN